MHYSASRGKKTDQFKSQYCEGVIVII